MYSIFVEKFAPIELIEIVWLCILSLPLMCNPLARWLNMRENHMFDFFKKREYSNVLPFPAPQAVPYIEPPPAPKKDPKVYYTFGITDDDRVTFTMGQTTLTMTKEGVDNLIKQLGFFRDQLDEDEE